MEELWVHAVHREGNELLLAIMQYFEYTTTCHVVVYFSHYIKFKFVLGQTQEEFHKFFWKTPLGRHIAKADPEMQTEFFQRYLQDFISMTMNVTCQQDLEVVFSVILNAFKYYLLIYIRVLMCTFIIYLLFF